MDRSIISNVIIYVVTEKITLKLCLLSFRALVLDDLHTTENIMCTWEDGRRGIGGGEKMWRKSGRGGEGEK